ncbi:MAG: Phosphoenolpyruvate synthase [Parcubacteria group bacterium GW2011_GWC1_43_11b]|nr:MAG: Phosphoenolpyruvate synthase [Parcubacteria group bacterium GW2011_GWB1_42_9]KKS89164.1 MAG: Phosphoenolpyruvate synthase [Parcubacteria group bacterium GW2011_GWC1_43_11b]
MRDQEFVLWFENLGIEDVPLVGGKNAALGEMYSHLTQMGLRVPNGFALTAYAYRYFLDKTGLKENIKQALDGLDTANIYDLQKRGKTVRQLIEKTVMPAELEKVALEAYNKLSEQAGVKNLDVAVRSSATAEDLPDASFAGQQETYLNVVGEKELQIAIKSCVASLFTDRAISYRVDKGFSHFDIALSVGVQRMVRSDVGGSGVAFSIDTETGFDKVVVINGSYGLGEMVVKGMVTPDEYIVYKPALASGHNAILAKTLGPKDVKLIYGRRGTVQVKVPPTDREKYFLTDAEITELAKWVVKIEEYFSQKHNRYQPMDIEWAKDGQTNELFIVQARPETVHTTADKNAYWEYKLKETGKVLVKGASVGAKIASGQVRIIKSADKLGEFKQGEILVTEMTDPDWEPIMKMASAIITDKGGRTSHAAIVSRELGVPCIVGCGNGSQILKTGQEVTIDCSSGAEGLVYDGKLNFEKIEHRLDRLPSIATKLMINVGSPDEAFRYHQLPIKGVGLGRLEFIITSYIKIHPNALLDFADLKISKDPAVKKIVQDIEALTVGYEDKAKYYVDELTEGIARIAAGFAPHDVIIRFSDFKTNEYRTLIGGELYEPAEENPMIGWRGASRYYHPKFKEAFALECQALKRVREEFGLTNVIPMIPFCRTPEEGAKVIAVMAQAGLDRAKDSSLKIYVMCEIPANILRAEDFLKEFDGMSIGSNDLAQLTLGIDRDSSIVSGIANENDPAVKKLIVDIIRICKAKEKYIGICGQAPSDYPDFADFLVKEGISSMSLNPDSVIKTIEIIGKLENKK